MTRRPTPRAMYAPKSLRGIPARFTPLPPALHGLRLRPLRGLRGLGRHRLGAIDPVTLAVLAAGAGVAYWLWNSGVGTTVKDVAGGIGTAVQTVSDAVSDTCTAYNNAAGVNTGCGQAPICKAQPWIGTGQALLPAQARGIALMLGNPGGGYELSPDRTQIWFWDGSYYDNADAHYYVVVRGTSIDQGSIVAQMSC